MQEGRSSQKQRAKRTWLRRFVTGGIVLAVLAVAVWAFFHFTQETRAVAGDYAVYREATGLESVTTTLTDQAWDTTVTQASLYSIAAGGTVTLSEAGHYIALYNIGTRVTTGADLSETQGYLNINGSQSATGRSSCIISNAGGQDECWLSGAAIFETTATNQTIKVQAQRTDTSGNTQVRSAGDSGFSLVRLSDDWNYARIREAGGAQAFNSATWATVLFDTNDELDAAGYSRTNGDITLVEAGRYIVTTNMQFQNTATNKMRLAATRLTLDGTEIPGTRVTALMPYTDSTADGVASFVGVIETTSANQVLRLQGACLGESCSKTENVGNNTAITLVKLPDVVEIVSVTEAGGGQQLDATSDPITWDTNEIVDSAAFSHSTGATSSRVQVNEADDYLFLSTFYSDRTSLTSTNRIDPHWEWRKNGSTGLTYGSFSHVNYGDNGKDGANRAGASGGAIFTSLSAGDYIEVLNTNESTDTDTDPTFQADLMGLQGIRLSTLLLPDIDVFAVGTQATNNSNIPENDFHVGGSFAFVANHTVPTETITDVTITETGSIDAANDVSDIRLYYEFDTSDPYNCVGETYSGSELQYGATSTAFSAANGSSTFSGSVVASTTQSVCMYVVLDIDDTASAGDILDIEISNPSVDVVLGGGPVGPADTNVAISGITTLIDDELRQMHYHWRNDDGTDETDATSAVPEVAEDIAILGLSVSNPRRLRIEVSNEGTATSPAVQYRLEYAAKSGTCATTPSGWTDVGAGGGAWDMFNSTKLTDGNNTTNILLAANGAVTDENVTFLTPNAAQKDTSSQTANITLTSSEFVEIEYSITATASAVQGETYCFRLTDAGATSTIASYDVYPEVTITADVLVSSLGTQTGTVGAGTADFYIGGTYVITDQAGSRNVTDITITETGSVDAQNDLSEVRLYYDLDVSDPYNCVSENYADGATQFGATSTAFSSTNGTSTFSDTVGISTAATMCVYAVVDVDSTANNGDTIDIEITDPGTEVVVSTGAVNPNTPVGPTDVTTVQKAELSQIHYHWRNDDGTEAGATSAAVGDAEDTPILDLPKNSARRLRIEVSNEGTGISPVVQYRLEYAPISGSCEATASGWTDVGAGGGDWDMYNTINLTDGNNTTNILLAANGAMTDENGTFLTPNGAQKDTSSQTANITLTSSEFVEIEYSIIATANATEEETYCFRVTNAGTDIDTYAVYPETTLGKDIVVSSLGAQTGTVSAGTPDFYIGGSFVLTDRAFSQNITTITLSETGSIDALNDLSNVRLYYELDTSDPYNCVGETYAGNEVQYGATSSAFSAADGTASFTDTVGVSQTASMCVYTVVDVDSTAADTNSINIEITDPSSDVTASIGGVTPNTPVGPTGETTVQKANLDQIHYHWRKDDGTEAGASSETNGVEDTAVTNVKKTDTQRLRMELSNEGTADALPSVFTLEYAEHSGACSAASGWDTVGEVGGAWTMSDSLNLTNGDNTTNIAEAIGGVTNENTTFLTPNGGVLETQATSSSLTLTTANYLELEFSIEATAFANFGATYCFRLTSDGTHVDTYTSYPRATIRQDQDFYIQRGVSTIDNTFTDVTITAGVDYVAPSATSSAFIRITNTMNTGAGATALGGAQNADVVTAYVSNPTNITSSIDFTRIGSTGDTKVYWEIIEYTGPVGGDNEMIVRHAEAYTTGSKVLTSAITVNGVVDDADAVVFLTGQGSEENNVTDYQTSIFTTNWNGGTGQAELTRDAYAGGPGNAGYVSFVVAEFTGSNWIVQRSEHTYTAVGTTETETITDVNDVSRAFIHAQHRTSDNTVGDFGHAVWLSGVGEVSFALSPDATTAGNHTSVAWILENTQTNGSPMVVTRSNGIQDAGGAEPATYSLAIGKTLTETDIASIFVTMYSSSTGTAHPQGIMGATIASTTHYELWISDTGAGRAYRTEVVEWPTAVLTVRQNYYRFYDDNDALDPTDPWPPGVTDLGENTSITAFDTPPVDGDNVRIRMSLNITGANFSAGQGQGKLQFAERDTTCTAISKWYDIGDIGSTTAIWRGYNATPADGTALSTNPPTGGELNLSVSDRAGTYEEGNPTAVNPYKILIGDDIEFDWNVQANGVTDLATYCFRMTWADGTPMDDYLYYPTVTMAGFEVESQDWRWFDDETVLTPLVPLAATNTAPINVAFDNALKLRVFLEEQAGKSGVNTKYKLQFSEYSDFTVVNDVDDMDTCTIGSEWCYFNGAGVEGATITDKVLSGGDSCVAGVGDGCGTHNEYSYTPDIVGEVGTTTTDNGGAVVALQHTYDDPVFIVEAISGDAAGGSGNRPAAAIITATSTSSFTVRIQEPDNEADTHGVETVAYIVMERGAYQLPDGRRVDVNTQDVNDYYGNAVGGGSDDTCTFTQTFTGAPVVLTSLQTNNNTGTPDFLTSSQALVTANDFACSMEVPDGETNAPGSAETYGWIAIEGGSFTNNGVDLVATTTSTSITGWTDTPWYEELFPYGFFTDIPGLLGNKQTRNGAEGGWVRYDSMDTDSVLLAIDERDDGERAHTSEVVGYLALSEGGVLYRAGTSDFTFTTGTKKEFEFTLRHNAAKANVTYFFRVYDVTRSLPVVASTTTSYPSLSTEGATLTFSITGVGSGSPTEGVVTDISTTATSVPFGTLTVGTDKNAAQRLTVSTNAREGYQILAFERQDLLSSGESISDITGTNPAPVSWSTGCSVSATGCYGYHVGDNTLAGGSTRFLLNDTYAALTGTMEEVAYSSGPVTNESTDIIYRVRVSGQQTAGRYESKIVYIVVPVF